MFSWFKNYTNWLHAQWPAGTVEKLPLVNADGSTVVPGLYLAGDITGIPLLKFSSHTGALAVQKIVSDAGFHSRNKGANHRDQSVFDLAIIGGGISGMAAALEARKQHLTFQVVEASEPFSTIVNFPRQKPIYTYPTDMTPVGDLQFSEKSNVKEGLLEELKSQILEQKIEVLSATVEYVQRSRPYLEVVLTGQENLFAHRVIVAIGRSGNFRKLEIPGENLDKVYNRLHDPKDHCEQNVLVVGGGDSALETAISIAECGGQVTLAYRRPEFSRPKPMNIQRLQALTTTSNEADRVTPNSNSGSVRLMMASEPAEIGENNVLIKTSQGESETLPNDIVFSMIGREPPLEFFRRSGIPIKGEWGWSRVVSFSLAMIFFTFLYHWKKGSVWLPVNETFVAHNWFPFFVPSWWSNLGSEFANPASLLGTLKVSLGEPGFYYSVVYTFCIVWFGIRRIRTRKTPYIKVQTLSLMGFQVLPLFLIPYIMLPWMGNNGWFDHGIMGSFADEFFPKVTYTEHGREYWRAFGFILAWPLFIWNVFHYQPLWGWLIVSLIQTFVIIPLIIYKWGKGAYCGFICSCGAMAETLGDAHRHKMPHGPIWNRMNMIGQVFLGIALLLLITRVLSWIAPGSIFQVIYDAVLNGLPGLNYVWFVDLLWAGIIGFGFYFHFSGRVWCRFACPLAALMHVYARFSKFRIFSEKKKCISCNVCTSVCHQGIDIMNFANKGLPMEDPECVRCSACVESCPTGVLTFGQIDPKTGAIARTDTLSASSVQMEEA